MPPEPTTPPASPAAEAVEDAAATLPPPPAASTTPPPSQPTGPSTTERIAKGAGRGIEKGARATFRALAERRGLRIALAGLVLVIVALEVGTGSALGLVLIIAGLTMLIIGSMGPRLRGRISMEFGPGGTSFEMQTHVAPPGRVLTLAKPDEDIGRPRMSLVPTEAAAPAPADAHVVESTGETVEIDVEQLKAMLAAERNSA